MGYDNPSYYRLSTIEGATKMTRFASQVAIITGGASGIGTGVAARMAEEGAHVVLFDVNEADLQKEVARIKEAGGSASHAVVDIADDGQVRSSIDQVAKDHGQLDILVNSAGIVGPNGTKAVDYPSDEFEKVISVNLTGAFLVAKYAIPHMLQRNYGRILLISSMGGKEGNPGMAGYAASKAGVMGLVKGIGKEYAETGITVNGLAPAVIRTPINLQTDPDMMRFMTEKIPMKRLGEIEEVAALICWICSKEATFNTGFVFDISGGRATY